MCLKMRHTFVLYYSMNGLYLSVQRQATRCLTRHPEWHYQKTGGCFWCEVNCFDCPDWIVLCAKSCEMQHSTAKPVRFQHANKRPVQTELSLFYWCLTWFCNTVTHHQHELLIHPHSEKCAATCNSTNKLIDWISDQGRYVRSIHTRLQCLSCILHI